MKRLKKRTTTRRRSNSPVDMVSVILEAIILLSIGLGFIGISFGISSFQIVLLLIVDIAVDMKNKHYNPMVMVKQILILVEAF